METIRWLFVASDLTQSAHVGTCMFEMCWNRSDSAMARVRQSDRDWVQEPVVEPGRRTQSLGARTVAGAASPHLQVRVTLGQARM